VDYDLDGLVFGVHTHPTDNVIFDFFIEKRERVQDWKSWLIAFTRSSIVTAGALSAFIPNLHSSN
jgi:hypothetical protein